MSHAALPVLRTPRLTLRPLTVNDADAIAEGIGNFDVSKWLAVVPYPYRRADAVAFIAKVLESGKPFWAICDAEGLRGIVCLDDELAYWLARPAWGRGYGFEAAHAAVAHWFADQSAEVLVSGYFDGNDKSGRLLTALGFEFDGQRVRHARSFRQNVVSNRMRLTRGRWTERQSFTLYTPRLTIRPLEPRDAPGLVGIARPDVARNMVNLPRELSLADAEMMIAESGYRGLPDFRLAIERNGAYVGGLGFGGTPSNLSFMLHPDAWGQGLMTEALSAFLPAMFERFPISRITSNRFEDDPVSGAVLRKMGFVEVGRVIGTSKARLEPAAMITYAVTLESLKVPL